MGREGGGEIGGEGGGSSGMQYVIYAICILQKMTGSNYRIVQ